MLTLTKPASYSVRRYGLFYRATGLVPSRPRRLGPRRWRAAMAWDDLFAGRLR